MTKISIEVTQELVDKSVPTDVKNCIIAKGIDAFLGDGLYAHVYPIHTQATGIVLIKDDSNVRVYRMALPIAGNFLALNFDSNLLPEVGTVIEFEIPDDMLKSADVLEQALEIVNVNS